MKLLSEITPVKAPRKLPFRKNWSISDQKHHKKSRWRLVINGRSVYLSSKKDAKKVKKFALKLLSDRYNSRMRNKAKRPATLLTTLRNNPGLNMDVLDTLKRED